MQERQVFIDTETTGLSARLGHRIVELAAIEAVDGKLTGKVFHSYLDPERTVDFGAERVHGLSSSWLRGKPKFSDVAATFVEFIRGAECFMHNAAFDTAFIDAELGRVGVPGISEIASPTCTMQVARKLFPGDKVTLDALLDRSGITGNRTTHSALEDAKLLAQVYYALLSPRPLSAIPEQIAKPDAHATMTPDRLGMEAVIELTNSRTETFFYRGKHKRIIDHRVVNPRRWKEIVGPLLYVVTDRNDIIRYVGKWESSTPLYSRWIRHDTIHHQESARNYYLGELDAKRGPLKVWSLSVRELRSRLPENARTITDKELAKLLEAYWINIGKNQLIWNSRAEPVASGFSDGGLWSNREI